MLKFSTFKLSIFNNINIKEKILQHSEKCFVASFLLKLIFLMCINVCCKFLFNLYLKFTLPNSINANSNEKLSEKLFFPNFRSIRQKLCRHCTKKNEKF
ncbi:hypothetical protein BpHYR1_012982 [Brachionus plicatilis]|uniref:Uncharacterized protein n=1 Tax=Brachionus plicatilis TaxID=10195 RepID=A0A3M7RB63_BRAPC|nr:hypothetical protein BpHYR1_012982 [Brachionus plicatilis]